ncbi:MAG: hypothetical protein QOE82_279 [Thermoanaerobaculia bacterium]|nr:hypothetical protein [Thermoanaerobaculia bacterium]
MRGIGNRHDVRAAYEQLTAEVDDGVAGELREHPIERVAFAEGAFLNRRTVAQRDRVACERDVVHRRSCNRCCERCVIRYAAGTARVPRLNQRPHERIERAIGFLCDLHRRRDQRVQLRGWLPHRAGVDASELRVIAPGADHRLDARCLGERGVDRHRIRRGDLAHRGHQEAGARDRRLRDRRNGRQQENSEREFHRVECARRSFIEAPASHAAHSPTITTENHFPYTPTGEYGSVAL